MKHTAILLALLSTIATLVAVDGSAQTCSDFQDVSTLYEVVPMSQAAYGAPYYTPNGLSFRSR